MNFHDLYEIICVNKKISIMNKYYTTDGLYNNMTEEGRRVIELYDEINMNIKERK